MRTKIIIDSTGENLEDKINDFIKNKEVVDIKYFVSRSYNNYSAMIMYKED